MSGDEWVLCVGGEGMSTELEQYKKAESAVCRCIFSPSIL